MKHWQEHEKLEKDPLAAEHACANEVCACALPKGSVSDYCGEYCKGEGPGRGEGTCQCGHIPCA
jgi:hypothetical protein